MEYTNQMLSNSTKTLQKVNVVTHSICLFKPV